MTLFNNAVSSAIFILRLFFILLLFNYTSFSQDVITINDISCGFHGSSLPDSKTYYLNELKNRYQFPAQNEFDSNISFQDILQSADPNQFSQDKALSLKGYVFNIKMGGVESCNCKAKDPAMRDTHIEITPDQNHTDPQYRIIAEVTPRIRQLMALKGIDWSTSSLRHLFKGKTVWIKGWLFYDAEHENAAVANDPDDAAGAVNWRASCWEIHPITDIQIIEDSIGFKEESNTPPEEKTRDHNNSRIKTPVDHKALPQPNAIDTQGNESFKYILAALVIFMLVIIVMIIYSRRR